jgi:hypothetical protein
MRNEMSTVANRNPPKSDKDGDGRLPPPVHRVKLSYILINIFMHHSPSIKWVRISLQLGLAFVFLWIGIKSLIEPQNWIGFIPLWLGSFLPISVVLFLKIHSIAEIILALWLLSGRALVISSALATLFLGLILLASGLNDITFRDVGLLTAAAALFFAEFKNKSHKSLMIG